MHYSLGPDEAFNKSSKSKRKIAILIVQDNLQQADCLTLETAFLCLGFDVERVAGKCGALDSTDSREFDLAFVDMRIAWNDLFHTIVSIRSHETPVIGLIADEKHYSRNQKSQLTVDDYVVLPANHSMLIELLRRWIV